MAAAELSDRPGIALDASRGMRVSCDGVSPGVAVTLASGPLTRLARLAHGSGPVVHAAAGVCLLTAIGALLGAIAPSLAPGGRPHPVLHGTLADAAGILATNLRLLGAPFLLVLFGLHRARRARVFGSLLVAGVIAVNTIHVGLAIGRFGPRLLPYLPQLPLEWLALALSGAAWLAALKHPSAKPRILATYAAAVLGSAVLAACCETLLTPHAPQGRPALRVGEPARVDSAPGSCSSRPAVDCLHPNPAPAGAFAAWSQAPFPSPYGLGSARPPWPALSGSVHHHDPQGGTR